MKWLDRLLDLDEPTTGEIARSQARRLRDADAALALALAALRKHDISTARAHVERARTQTRGPATTD